MDKKEKFFHDAKEFEIRLAQIGDKYSVKVFYKNIQISPEYSVDIEAHRDYFAEHKESLVQELISTAKSDLKKGIYYKT